MDKKDVMINELNKKIEQLNQEKSELIEKNDRLELLLIKYDDEIENLQKELRQKESLIEHLKCAIKLNNKEILNQLLEGKDIFGAIKFIIERMGL
jgi:predicted nuclease with TOPRIM domain